MEKIGFISTIIALILCVGFIFYAKNLDKVKQKNTVKSKELNEQKNTFGETLITLLFFVFLITFFLSTFLS